MYRKVFAVVGILVILLQALLWLRIILVLLNVQRNFMLISLVMRVTDLMVGPFAAIFHFDLYILNFKLDLAAIFVVIALSTISYLIPKSKKAYDE